jgi:hypothetical protein
VAAPRRSRRNTARNQRKIVDGVVLSTALLPLRRKTVSIRRRQLMNTIRQTGNILPADRRLRIDFTLIIRSLKIFKMSIFTRYL